MEKLEVEAYVLPTLGNYTAWVNREFPGIRSKRARLMGGTDMMMIGSKAAMDLALGLGTIATFMVSIVFWGFIIFTYAIGWLFQI